MSDDPLHVPAALRGDKTDYQWMAPGGPRDPAATGWQLVDQDEMPGFHVERKELRLYKRPMALTEHVRAQEIEVARAVHDDPPSGRRVARGITTPMGPLPQGWTAKRWAISIVCRLRRRYGRADSPWLVGKFYGTNALGLRRWSEENQMGPTLYLAHLTNAILKGRGRWLGQIIVGRSR